jgi:hypothetical protein
MGKFRQSKTLFEAVPAIGAVSAQGVGVAMLVPVGFEHPGITLREGQNRIGRDPTLNEHVVPSSHVSRTHCEIFLEHGEIWVRDLGSHNGTYVNEERTTERRLEPGDRVGLSLKVTFVLAMDSDLQGPIGMELDFEERPITIGAGRVRAVEPPPTHSAPRVATPVAPRTAPMGTTRPPILSRPGRATTHQAAPAVHPVQIDAEMDDSEAESRAHLKQVEQQRNVLAILYQVTLRCLMSDSPKEIEKLLTNVIERLVPLDAGFILYQSGNVWRATICPGSKQRPSDGMVRAFYQAALEQRSPFVALDPQDLAALGLPGGSALVVPLLLGDTVSGVVGAVSARVDVYNAEVMDMVVQLANITAASLRDRG